MIRFLPFILIAVVVLGGLGYYRYEASKPSLNSKTSVDTALLEVPKTLPAASLDDRVTAIESLMTKVVSSINTLKSASTQNTTASNVDLSALNASITELKARVSALESGSSSTTTTTSSTSKSTIYIPLGSGGSVESTDWTSLNTFQITLDPSQYPGYTSMQLEVNMRLNQPGGTLYARLLNNTSGSATSSEATTTSTDSKVISSATFTLPSGSKTFLLQAKTSDGTQGFLDYARIRVNF